MKTKIYVTYLLALILTSCGNTQQPATFSKETDAIFNDYRTYLSNVYSEGDIVLLETENGDVEEMRVTSSYAATRIGVVPETDEDLPIEEATNTTNKDSGRDIRAIEVTLTARRNENSFLGVFVAFSPSGVQHNHLEIKTNRPENTPFRIPAPSPSDNMIVLQTDAGWCLLERGVGIVQIADTLGHTWKLVE